MALLEIVKWPAPVLDTPADPVTEFDDDLQRLVSNMFETMYAAPGVGLDAVQVGVSKRLFVMDCSGGKDPKQRVVLINPEVLRVEGNQNGEEGCLSFPGGSEEIKRAERVRVRALDIKGQPFELEAEGLLAVAIQHENDHLNGVLMIDKLGPIKRRRLGQKIKKARDTEASA